MSFLTLNTIIYTVPGVTFERSFPMFGRISKCKNLHIKNIVDIVIVALAIVANITVVACLLVRRTNH